MYPELAQFRTWMKCQYPNSSASVHYSSDLTLFFSFTNKPPAKVTSKDIDHYISHSLQQGNKPATVNRRLSALHTFYYFLSMPCDLPLTCPVLPRHRLRKSYPLPRDVDDSSIQALFHVISCSRDRAMFRLMLDCGLRVGEVHSLSSDDIHFEDPPSLLVYGKGGRQRRVYLSPPTQHALIEWLNSRPISNDRAVFISADGKRLSISGIQYLLRGYCETAGIHFTCHQLRHTFGRHMAEAKMPLASLQSFLGYKSVRTTQIYVHLSNDHLQTEYNRAIARIGAPESAGTLVTRPQSQCIHKSKEINWDGYLGGLPDWLADLIRAYCSQYSQANDPVQQARNRLSQLSGIFRWILAHTSLSCLGKLTPKLWFACVETRLKLGRKPASINTTLRVLQSFLRFVRDPGHLICERMLEIRPLKTSELLPRDVTEAQLNQLLRHANPFDYAWILLFVNVMCH